MFFVYALKSLSREYIYVGMTNNLERRIKEHNSGLNGTTRPYAPFTILLVEEYENRIIARAREKFLKSGVGKEYLRSLINK